ncbi:MAG: anthranilate phosphoribosyltransferase [Lachnospiraceae bacterium]|jgi:anthranilate phosphoribosyltransferase|nr:anthranilate phosphoribosyltransferase [Lachnospiraceae bacterium]
MQRAIQKVVDGQNLTEEEARRVMNLMLSGEATQAQLGAFLTAMRMKGETLEELTGFATVLKEKAQHIKPRTDNYVDLVGTGGDRTFTFNVSTTSAFVAAGAGLPIAKHGNRSISSKSGAGDVLEALGVNITAEPDVVTKCVEEAGLGFMFAPSFNKSMKYVGQARKDMGIRSVFNILGPLANPSDAKCMVVGVYDPSLTQLLANAMSHLGIERGFVVSGEDDMDEFTLTGSTTVSEIKDGRVDTYQVSPEQFGLHRASLEELQGGDGEQNAQITTGILKGEIQGAKREIVLLNAGATLYAGGLAENIEDGIRLAADSINSGRAFGVLERLVELSNEKT